MDVNKNPLLQLYSISLEQVRHHARLFAETWIPIIIFISVFGTLGFFVSRDLFHFQVPLGFRLFMTLLGYLIGYAFLHALAWRSEEGEQAREITTRIAAILEGKKELDTTEIGELLVLKETPKTSQA